MEGFSSPSHVDNIVRGVFIRAHQSQDLEKQRKKKQQIGKYKFFNYHRSLTDVIIIEDQSLLEQNQHFKKWTPEYWKESLNKIQESSEDGVGDSEDDADNNTGDEAGEGTADDTDNDTDDEVGEGTDNETDASAESEIEEPRNPRRSKRLRDKTSLAALLIFSKADLAHAQMLKEEGEKGIYMSIELILSFIFIMFLISILYFRWKRPGTGILSASIVKNSKQYHRHTPHTQPHSKLVDNNIKMFVNCRLKRSAWNKTEKTKFKTNLKISLLLLAIFTTVTGGEQLTKSEYFKQPRIAGENAPDTWTSWLVKKIVKEKIEQEMDQFKPVYPSSPAAGLGSSMMLIMAAGALLWLLTGSRPGSRSIDLSDPPPSPKDKRKDSPPLSPEKRKDSPPLSPEKRKDSPPLSPEKRKDSPPLSPEKRKDSPPPLKTSHGVQGRTFEKVTVNFSHPQTQRRTNNRLAWTHSVSLIIIAILLVPTTAEVRTESSLERNLLFIPQASVATHNMPDENAASVGHNDNGYLSLMLTYSDNS